MKKKNNNINKEIEKTLKLFKKVAKSGIQINSTQAVREERDRDNPKKDKSKPNSDPIDAFFAHKKNLPKLTTKEIIDAIHKGRK